MSFIVNPMKHTKTTNHLKELKMNAVPGSTLHGQTFSISEVDNMVKYLFLMTVNYWPQMTLWKYKE